MNNSDNLKTDENRQLNITATFISIISWFKYLSKKWGILMLAGLLGGTCGVLYAYFEKPKYQSHLTFAIEEGESSLGGALSLAAEFGFSLGGAKNIFEGDNILNLLTSRRIIERVLLSVDTVNGKPITMVEYYRGITSDSTKKKKVLSEKELSISSVSFPAWQPRSSFTYLQDSILMNVYKDILLSKDLIANKPDKRLNLYEISVTSPDERFSKVFTDRLIDEATRFYVELRSRKSKETLDILEARVAQTRNSLGNAINSRAGLQDANVNPAFQRAQAKLQQKQVDISAYGGAYSELYKNLELARYQYLKDIPLLQVIDSADYPMKKLKNGRLKMGIVFALITGFLTTLFFLLKYIVITNLKDHLVALPEERNA